MGGRCLQEVLYPERMHNATRLLGIGSLGPQFSRTCDVDRSDAPSTRSLVALPAARMLYIGLAMDFQLLAAKQADQKFLEQLFVEVRAPEFAALQLPATALEQLLAMQFRAQTLGYAASFPDAVDRIIRVDGESAGRLLVDRNAAEIQIVDIALLTRYRGRGIGTKLLCDLCAEALDRGLPLYLSVRFDNPAARLYERCGFIRTGSDGINTTMAFHRAPAALDSTDQASARDESPVPQDYTSRYFHSLVGQTLAARGTDGTSVPLKLDRVRILDPQGNSVATKGLSHEPDSFVLEFLGPVERVLPSAIATLTPADGQPMDIFLSPLGPKHGLMQYEAAFVRLAGPSPA